MISSNYVLSYPLHTSSSQVSKSEYEITCVYVTQKDNTQALKQEKKKLRKKATLT